MISALRANHLFSRGKPFMMSQKNKSLSVYIPVNRYATCVGSWFALLCRCIRFHSARGRFEVYGVCIFLYGSIDFPAFIPICLGDTGYFHLRVARQIYGLIAFIRFSVDVAVATLPATSFVYLAQHASKSLTGVFRVALTISCSFCIIVQDTALHNTRICHLHIKVRLKFRSTEIT